MHHDRYTLKYQIHWGGVGGSELLQLTTLASRELLGHSARPNILLLLIKTVSQKLLLCYVHPHFPQQHNYASFITIFCTFNIRLHTLFNIIDMNIIVLFLSIL